MISFIHTADVHLDAPLISLSAVYEQRQYDFRQTMQRVRDLVIEKQADFWLIAGDLLEYHGGTRATALFLQELFASVEPAVVCIAPGNHDPWMAGSFYLTLEWPANVVIFTPEWGVYEFPEKSCVIYGWGFPHAHVHDSPLADFPGKLPDYRHHIMLLHGSVQTGTEPEHHPYAPLPLAALAETGMDYVALGHIHKPIQYSHPVRGGVFAAYPGTPEGLTAKETGERSVLYGQCKGSGEFQLEPIPVQTRQIRRLELELGGAETTEKLIQRVEEQLREHSPADLLYVELTGERAAHLNPPLELLYERCKSFFYIHFEDRTWPDVDEEKLIAEGSLLGRWLRQLRDLEADSEDGRKREIVQLARREALKRIGGNLR
ncbi:exonuclease SbcCD subunit D [Brevibacillus sp. B_LB10_24]|uniref:metallophosphoesterase family protein n=1 Tax=Brevibacillus sp. B_LB10_24 TaxID=3380645 RepID=UPI0038BB5BF0